MALLTRRPSNKLKLDLRLYLVTDSTPEILGGKDICHVVDQALEGGVTVVQYRDKHADTRVLIETARKLHQITQKHGVPLLINDRIDVCLAVGAEGVHIGQDDMDISTAKRLLPADAIVGVTASSVDEAAAAISGGADYLGIGTIFATPTKKDTKSVIGTIGAREILTKCNTGVAHSCGAVAIGSINKTTLQRVMHQTSSDKNRLDGLAVVSAVMGSDTPREAASELRQALEDAHLKFYVSVAPGVAMVKDKARLLKSVPSLIEKHSKSAVLCHNMTNTVVQNFAANVCLATGSSPIMSLNAAEAADLANLGGALVINMGTLTPDTMHGYLTGLQAYNYRGNATLFDPVGGGATSVRREAIKTIMAGGFFDLVKGNEGEICAVAGSSNIQQRGVDSGPSNLNSQEKAALVKELAQRERCMILMTGRTDYLSDGVRTVVINNGSSLLGNVTGSGCALGSVIASYMAIHREDKFVAAIAGILHYEIAAERAEHNRESCQGPGSFIPAFLDELSTLPSRVSNNEYVQLSAMLEFL